VLLTKPLTQIQESSEGLQPTRASPENPNAVKRWMIGKEVRGCGLNHPVDLRARAGISKRVGRG
jgi:hypothetical protein